MKNLVLLFLLVVNIPLFGQLQEVDVAKAIGESITAGELKDHLYILASDAYEGRETGQAGQKKAAGYIANYFESLGLPKVGQNNSYFQKILFSTENWTEISLAVNGEDERHLWNYYAYPTTNVDANESINEVVFMGYGIDTPQYSDYKNANVRGKTIMIFNGEPRDKEGNSYLTGSSDTSDWHFDWRKKLITAKEKGAKTVLIVDDNFKKNVREARRAILNSRLKIVGAGEEEPIEKYPNNLFITSELAKKIIGSKYKKVVKSRKKISKKGKLKPITLESNIRLDQKKNVRKLEGENVLGFIEGSDEKLKEEIVIITAHYDHLGTRGDDIYNGADDNGSGTSTVLEITEAFAQAKKNGEGPKRSVLTMLVSGEEKGLLGSLYYVNNPMFKLENSVVNINIDMVGRVDEAHKNNPKYIYVIGSDRLSSDLHEINETVNSKYTQLELDYTYNAEDDPNRYYYRSDHYNFAERGIPAIFYFNGTHADYHRTTDTPEKINYEKMAIIGKLAFHTAWEIANREERIKVDKE